MTEAIKLGLTGEEAAIFLHRLDVPDAIGEALTDVPEGTESAFTPDEVVDAADRLQQFIRERCALPEAVTAVERAVLIDCLDGTTFDATYDEQRERDPGRQRRILNKADALLDRVAALPACVVCPACNGEGVIDVRGAFMTVRPCFACGGSHNPVFKRGDGAASAHSAGARLLGRERER